MSVTTMETTSCPACGLEGREEFFDFGRLPVFANVLYECPGPARSAPRAPIRLGWCRGCAHIGNLDFEPALVSYMPGYENSLHFSPRFVAYAEKLAHHLADRYDLAGKDVVEIGCGDGHFLSMLFDVGGNRGLGFDPSFDPEKATAPYRGEMRVSPTVFPDDPGSLGAHLIVCRHVLEHVPRPLEFLARLRRAIGDEADTAVYLEVPNGRHMLESDGLWDIVYEHASYFTPETLESMCRRAGFEPIEVSTGFGGQFLSIEARPAEPEDRTSAPGTGLTSLVLSFGRRQRAKLERWRERLAGFGLGGARAVAWGGGSKGVTFLNALDAGIERIPAIVDVNPRKHGRFVPGTGQEVVPPERLRELEPDVVVLMNSAYLREVGRMLGDLWLGPEILTA